MRGDSGNKDRKTEPAAIPNEPAAEEVHEEQQDSDTTQDAPDTPTEEQPAKPGQSWTGMNIDSFIKPYSDDKETGESPDNGSSEQPPH